MISPPKKILHVIDSLDLGGAQTFLLDLVKHHDRSRYLPEVAAMHGRGVYTRAFEEVGITVHSLSPGKFPPWYLPNFRRLMKDGGHDILHFHLFGANLCAKPIAVLSGHPAIITHDQCNDASRDQNRLLLAADALWNQFTDRVIAVSESTRRYLLDHEDLDDARVSMIPNGIDAGMFKPASATEREKAREVLGIPPGVLVIGGVGRLVSQKNFSLFLRIAAMALETHSGLLFVIAGTGPMHAQLLAEARSRGIEAHVLFLGHVSNRVALYQSLDALLMTSDFEGTPMALLEAMASGLPVIASRVDGIGEVCTDGIDALLAPSTGPEGFVDCLDRALSQPALREKLGSAARETVLSGYDIRVAARRIEQLYEEVLE
jgi:L-malate glycosyltransferase